MHCKSASGTYHLIKKTCDYNRLVEPAVAAHPHETQRFACKDFRWKELSFRKVAVTKPRIQVINEGSVQPTVSSTEQLLTGLMQAVKEMVSSGTCKTNNVTAEGLAHLRAKRDKARSTAGWYRSHAKDRYHRQHNGAKVVLATSYRDFSAHQYSEEFPGSRWGLQKYFPGPVRPC